MDIDDILYQEAHERRDREEEKAEIEALEALHKFLKDNDMDLQACSCCFAITVYWKGKEIACDIGSVEELEKEIERRKSD
jgi:hypothetical protein